MKEGAPIAVFDSGVGSYSVVREMRSELPSESLVYFADRASFPYGEKTHDELAVIVQTAIGWLEKNFEPKLIIVASNTPSLEVPRALKSPRGTRVMGIFPPLKEAEENSKNKEIAVLATRGTIESPELESYIKKQNLRPETSVYKADASRMVGLVESGIFLSDPDTAEKTIRETVDPLLKQHPNIDVMTLSSTHLPFLADYLRALYPSVAFLDPAASVARDARAFLESESNRAKGEGGVRVFATENKAGGLTIDGFRKILALLGLDTSVEKAVL